MDMILKRHTALFHLSDTSTSRGWGNVSHYVLVVAEQFMCTNICECEHGRVRAVVYMRRAVMVLIFYLVWYKICFSVFFCLLHMPWWVVQDCPVCPSFSHWMSSVTTQMLLCNFFMSSWDLNWSPHSCTNTSPHLPQAASNPREIFK